MPHKVLVVDDDPEIVGMLTRWLARRGYEVLSASDGDDALVLAGQESPDLVILDVMMPRMNGWETAKALRQNPDTENIRILILTAIGNRMNEMTSPLYGVDAFIDKPFDFTHLQQVIESLLPGHP